MSTPPSPRGWGGTEMTRLASAFEGQERVGILAGLVVRLQRFLGGDPAIQINASFSGGTVFQLPDNTTAQSAVLHVGGAAMSYRVDGAPTNGAEPSVPAGTVLTLTGNPTLRGFRAAATGAGTVTLTGSYFD